MGAPIQEKSEVLEYCDHPFLVDENSISYIANSKCMFILRGVSGAGKTKLAKCIADKYHNLAKCIADKYTVVAGQLGSDKHELVVRASADDYFLQDGHYTFMPELLGEAHALCQSKVKNACLTGARIVIVDNTNIRLWEMEPYLEIARFYNYRVILVEPKTPWKHDPHTLSIKSIHAVAMASIERKLSMFETVLPLYYAWYPHCSDSHNLHDTSANILDQCFLSCQQFRDWFMEISGNTRPNEVDVHMYYYGSLRTKPRAGIDDMHITAMFSGHGQRPGSAEYAASDLVTSSLGRVFLLEVTGFTITRDTLGARVRLSDEAAPLWKQSDKYLIRRSDRTKAWTEGSRTSSKLSYISRVAAYLYKSCVYLAIRIWRTICLAWHRIRAVFVTDTVGESKRVEQKEAYLCPRGSRAHITMGYSEMSRPVQTGYDQLEVVYCEEVEMSYDGFTINIHDHGAEPMGAECNYTNVRRYGDSVWAIYLNRPITISSMFTGCY